MRSLILKNISEGIVQLVTQWVAQNLVLSHVVNYIAQATLHGNMLDKTQNMLESPKVQITQ